MDAKEIVVGGDVLELKDAEARNLLGSETLDTEATTVTGAINELNSNINNVIIKNLGTSFTAEQSADIRAGNFKLVHVGGYWTINGRKYWAAHADYRLHCGDTELTTSSHTDICSLTQWPVVQHPTGRGTTARLTS